MVTPLGTLLSLSFHRCRERLQPFLIGVLLFGSLVAIVSSVTTNHMEGQIWQGMDRMGVDQSRMMELQEQLQSGDPDAAEEAMQEMAAMMQNVEGMSEEDRNAMFQREGYATMIAILPVLAIGILGYAVISLLATSYYLFFSLGKGKDAVEILNNSLRMIFPLLGVWIWSMLRSFVWIPIIGIIPAVILGPRFALAPVILVAQDKGVTGSVSESYAKTRGYWGKIVGNMFVLSLILGLVSWGIGLVTIPVGMTSRVLSIWVHSVVQQGTMAYGIMFLVLLTKTILENAQTQVKSGKKAKA